MGFKLPRKNKNNGRTRFSRSTNTSRGGTTAVPKRPSHRSTPAVSRSSVSWTPLSARSTPGSSEPSSEVVRRIVGRRAESNNDAIDQNDSIQQLRDDSIDDTLNEIFMAVNCTRKNSIGCAYYVASEEKLFLMEDITLGNVEIVEALKVQIDPTTIIISVTAEDQLINLLGVSENQNIQGGDDSAGSASPVQNVETVPPSAFKYDPAVQKLLNLGLERHDSNRLAFSVPGDVHTLSNDQVNQMDEGSGHRAELFRLSGSVAMDNQLSVGCAGAILGYITKRRASRFLPNDDNAQLMFRVSEMEIFTIKDQMLDMALRNTPEIYLMSDSKSRFINRDALCSLQIFDPESHSHSLNQRPINSAASSKGGLSIYGLFQHLARTPQGKVKLRQWFLRPSLSIEVLNERLDAISVFLRPENSTAFEDICKALRHVIDARRSILNLKKGISGDLKKPSNLGRSVWYGLREFAYQATSIEKCISDVAGIGRLPLFRKIRESFNISHLAYAGQMIHDMIEFGESEDPSRIVKSGIDSSLDEKRRLYDGVDSLLAEVARDISMDVPEGLPANLNVVYFPQIGFLISMPKDQETGRSLWEGSEADVWQIMFSSDNSVYYKNDKMKQMDAYIGDIWNDICDKEIEILHDLSLKVLQFDKAFVEASDLCSELDCIVALAIGARKYGWRQPQLTRDNVIDIKQGRHPLQELLVPSFVPNDTYLRGAVVEILSSSSAFASETGSETAATGPNVVLLTGPNFSGKSVYLKQVALTVYLAHIGSFVPAEKARIGLTDKILTRITTRESVSACSSAFALDLQQMNLALKLATSRSLLLIDEFGKGTGTADGAGMFAGVIKNLLVSDESRAPRDCKTPKVLAATHFHELFEMDILKSSPALAFGHMEIRIDESSKAVGSNEAAKNGSAEQLVYLYNYRNGRSVKSYGTCCAALNGIEPEIVQRAEHLVKLAARGENLVAACAIMSKDEMEDLKDAERVARAFLQRNLDGDAKQLLNQVFGTT